MPETNTQQSQPAVAGRRKEIVGEVVSNRMKKTIVVEVVRKKSHAFYGRVVSKAKKFYAHDEKNEAHTGDLVMIGETRPMSKNKCWRLVKVVEKAK